MDNSPNKNVPDEYEIEDMLSHIRPQPTSRFYSRMRTAPWLIPNSSKSSDSLPNRKPIRRLALGLVAIIIIIAVLGIALFPSVRAIARQIFFSFITAPSNQIQIQVTPARPGDQKYFSDPANFTLSVSEVQQQVGFKVKSIGFLPEGLIFTGSRYDPSYNTVTELYQGKNYKLFLTQRPQGNGQDVFSIGASAIVKLVKIGDIQGEFVVGGWKAISTQPASENQTPTSLIAINAIWDNDLPQSTLRWQSGGIVYELRSIGEGNLSQSDLPSLANGLK
jgi:hypothetical protein